MPSPPGPAELSSLAGLQGQCRRGPSVSGLEGLVRPQRLQVMWGHVLPGLSRQDAAERLPGLLATRTRPPPSSRSPHPALTVRLPPTCVHGGCTGQGQAQPALSTPGPTPPVCSSQGSRPHRPGRHHGSDPACGPSRVSVGGQSGAEFFNRMSVFYQTNGSPTFAGLWHMMPKVAGNVGRELQDRKVMQK